MDGHCHWPLFGPKMYYSMNEIVCTCTIKGVMYMAWSLEQALGSRPSHCWSFLDVPAPNASVIMPTAICLISNR